MAKNIIGSESFIETFVDANIETCKMRDVKGLYKLAEEGKIKEFTGISSPYERPISPAIHIHTDMKPLDSCVNQIINYLALQNIVSFQSAKQLQ